LERTGRDFQVSWNPESDIMVGAASGILTIQQGNATRAIALTNEELRDGRIFYLDATNPGSFRLRVVGINGSIVEVSAGTDAMPSRPFYPPEPPKDR
jgi:hypothetical protein